MAPSSSKPPPDFSDKTSQYDKKLMGKMLRASKPVAKGPTAIREKYDRRLRNSPVRPMSDKEVTRVQCSSAAAKLVAALAQGSTDPFETPGLDDVSSTLSQAKRTLIDAQPPLRATTTPVPARPMLAPPAQPTAPAHPRFLTDTEDPTRYRPPGLRAQGTELGALDNSQLDDHSDVTVNYLGRRGPSSLLSPSARPANESRVRARGSSVPPADPMAETMLPPVPSATTPEPEKAPAGRLETIEELVGAGTTKRNFRGAVPKKAPGRKSRMTTGAVAEVGREERGDPTPTATIVHQIEARRSGGWTSLVLLVLSAAATAGLWWFGAFEWSTSIGVALLPAVAIGCSGLLATTLGFLRIPRTVIVTMSSLASASALALATFLAAWTQGWRELPWPNWYDSAAWPLEISGFLAQLTGFHGPILLLWAAGLLFAVTLVSSMRAAR